MEGFLALTPPTPESARPPTVTLTLNLVISLDAATKALVGRFAPPQNASDRLDALEKFMATASDAMKAIADHVTALESRDAARTAAFADVQAKLAELQPLVADNQAAAELSQGIIDRLDKVEADAPAPVPPVVQPPAEPPAGS